MAIQTQKELIDTGVSEIVNYLETSKLKHLNKAFRIQKYSSESKLFFYIGLIGLITYIITSLIPVLWTVMWIYALVVIILLGFIFTGPNSRYNFVIVLGIFTILAFIPSIYGQGVLSVFSLDIVNETNYSNGFIEALGQLASNPLANLELYSLNLINVLNWIFFIGCGGYGAFAISDVITFQYGEAAKKAALIAIALTIYTFITSIFNLISSAQVPTIWETVGTTVEELLSNIGLASLDQSGNTVVNVKTITNGIFSWIPLLIVIGMFAAAFYFRKIDFKSILFARHVTKDNTMSVKRTNYSIPAVVLLLVMGLYVVGYFLITADPEVVINPLITIVFYLFAVVVLLLITLRMLILNKSEGPGTVIYKAVKWTIFGLMGLFMWFQVFQPVVYTLGLIDYETGLLTLSQGASVFENDLLEQLFLVAMPETLIFQVFFLGLGNRIYFYFRKTRILVLEEERIQDDITRLSNEYNNIRIVPNSITQANLRNLTRLAVLDKKIYQLQERIKEGKISKVSISFFILPSLISGLIGSFFFSWYHSFRRGIDFITWWQNPMLGMVYFGAGFFLCLVCFYSLSAGILTHGFNNIIAIMLLG